MSDKVEPTKSDAAAPVDDVERMRGIEELRESEERFRQITTYVEEVFWIADPAKGQVLYVSPAYEKIWGRTPESLYADPGGWLEAIHSDDQARVRAAAARPVGSYDEEYRVVRPDGSLRWIHDRAYPVLDGAGRVHRVVGVAEDVTTRKEATEALRRSEEKLSKAFQSSPDGLAISRLSDGALVDVNDAFVRLTGYSREEVLGKTTLDLAMWADVSDRATYLATLQARGHVREQPLTLRDRAGAFRDCIVSGEILHLDADVLALTTVRDVSALKRAIEELRESERRFSGMLANLRLLALMLDQQARITYCNDYLLAITGWQRDEVLGRSWFDLFVPQDAKDAEDMKEIFAALLRDSPDAWHHENEIMTKAGGRRMIRWNNSILRSSGGEVVGTASIGEDVTDHKRMEEQIRLSQKMEAIGGLAGGIAHDFNNLLSVITGYSQMLRRNAPEGGVDRRRIEQIIRAAERAAGLTRQLLAFSRKQVLEPRVLEPSAVVADMQKMLERLIGEDVDLVLRTQAAGRVKVDPGQLEQVVMNLVVNSRDAMPLGGALTIETSDVDLDEASVQSRGVAVKPGRYVMLAVTDTGHGMDAATQARIFEPFFTTKVEGKGTGLGLATVYGIVEQSGGQIRVFSEVGKGTIFRVYLPRVEEPKSQERPRTRAPQRRASETVLVVEDEAAARELVIEVLRDEGYTVLAAGNGEEAVQTAGRATAPIDLLLTDVILPKLSGPLVAQRVREIHPGIKVLYMSGYTDDAISHHGVLQPGVALLQKPFTPDDLTRRIGEILDEGRPVETP